MSFTVKGNVEVVLEPEKSGRLMINDSRGINSVLLSKFGGFRNNMYIWTRI